MILLNPVLEIAAHTFLLGRPTIPKKRGVAGDISTVWGCKSLSRTITEGCVKTDSFEHEHGARDVICIINWPEKPTG